VATHHHYSSHNTTHSATYETIDSDNIIVRLIDPRGLPGCAGNYMKLKYVKLN